MRNTRNKPAFRGLILKTESNTVYRIPYLLLLFYCLFVGCVKNKDHLVQSRYETGNSIYYDAPVMYIENGGIIKDPEIITRFLGKYAENFSKAGSQPLNEKLSLNWSDKYSSVTTDNQQYDSLLFKQVLDGYVFETRDSINGYFPFNNANLPDYVKEVETRYFQKTCILLPHPGDYNYSVCMIPRKVFVFKMENGNLTFPVISYYLRHTESYDGTASQSSWLVEESVNTTFNKAILAKFTKGDTLVVQTGVAQLKRK